MFISPLKFDQKSPPDKALRIVIVSVSSPRHSTLWNSLASESLAGDLRGYFADKVKVLVLRAQNEEEFNSVLSSLTGSIPDILGISVECGGVQLAIALVEDFLARIKKNGLVLDSPHLVFGGKIPSCFPDLFLTKFPSSFVVVGEGEIPLRRIVLRYFSEYPEPMEDIPNLAYIDKKNNQTTISVEQCSISALIYPPGIDTVPKLLSAGAGTFLVQASRGCSWSNCSYCTVKSFRGGRKWEPLPWGRTKKHLESLISMKVREFEFCDDEFLGGRGPEQLERAHAIADDLTTLGNEFINGIAFRIFLIPHSIFRSDDPAGNETVINVLKHLKKAGLVRIYFGVESGSKPQLKRYCRGTTLEEVEAAIEVVRSLGLGIDCGYIMFDPLATLDDLAENIWFFRKHGLVEYNQWPFRPLVANKGATLGRVMAHLGLPIEPEFMRYQYKFRNPQVQRIFDIVDAISSETRYLFYTLKVLSKTHFDPAAETHVNKRAKYYLIQNAQIYLDLMDNLLRVTDQRNSDRIESMAVLSARNNIMQLVKDIAEDIETGRLRDVQGRLCKEIALSFQIINHST